MCMGTYVRLKLILILKLSFYVAFGLGEHCFRGFACGRRHCTLCTKQGLVLLGVLVAIGTCFSSSSSVVFLGGWDGRVQIAE